MKLSINIEHWPVEGHFTIARSRLTDVSVLTVTLKDGTFTGRGECRPYPRYDEAPESVAAQIEKLRPAIEAGMSRTELQNRLPSGAARNAVDCALWDLDCKRQGRSIWELWEQRRPVPQATAFTLSLDTPENMAKAAHNAADFTLLKLKVEAAQMSAQIKAVAAARPDCRFIIDANESLDFETLKNLVAHPAKDKIALIEQPLHDDIISENNLSGLNGPPICADESLHNIDDLPKLKALGYKAINIKLDKCGGVTAAQHLISSAKEQGFMIMGGCMLSTSLAVAPMAALMGHFDIVDLDGGALLKQDREFGLLYENGAVYPPTPKLWG